MAVAWIATIDPTTVVDDAGSTVFTITGPVEGVAFDSSSIPKLNGVLPTATVAVVDGDTLTMTLDPADLAPGIYAVTVHDLVTHRILAGGAVLEVTAAP